MKHCSLLDSPIMNSLQLPQEIVDNIVWWTRQICRNDDFFCDLRLINHQFNEAAIYHFFFCDNAPTAKHRFNHRPSCLPCAVNPTSFGRFNRAYARMQLQTSLHLQAGSENSALRHWFASLKEAISLLEAALAESDLCAARHRIEADRRFVSSTSHPVLADRISLIICDAAIHLLEIANNGCLRDWREHRPKGCLHLAPPSYWIMITAYHIGDMNLLKRFLLDTSFMKLIRESEFGSLTMCLSIAARQGHKDVLFEVMNNYLKVVYYNKGRILTQAYIAQQTECTDLLNFIGSADERYMVLDALLQNLANTRLYPAIHVHAFKTLMHQCGSALNYHTTRDVLRRPPNSQLNTHVERALKNLKAPDWDSWKEIRGRSPSKDGHQCMSSWFSKIQDILYRWQHVPESVPTEEFNSLCRMMVQLAIEIKRVELVEASYEQIGKDVVSLDIQSLLQAGRDEDGDRILEARDVKEPTVWHRPVSHKHAKITIGQWTLCNALSTLQADNARFLLERQVRLPETMMPIQVDWRYRRTRDRQYEATQQLLEVYGMKLVEVSLKGSSRLNSTLL